MFKQVWKLCRKIETHILDYCQNVLEVVAADDTDSVTVIDFFRGNLQSQDPLLKNAALTLLCSYCSKRKFDLSLAPSLLSYLIALYKDDDLKVLELSAKTVTVVFQNLKHTDQMKLVSDVCLAVKCAMFQSKDKEFLPGLCDSKGFDSILLMYEKVILKGIMKDKRRAVRALRQLILFSSEEALQSSLCSLASVLTCVLVRYMNEMYTLFKITLVETLTTLIAKGCLETKEYILNEVTRCLNLHPSRICVVAALLGNHIITDADLASFHKSLCPDTKGKVAPNSLIKAIVDYVRNLNSVDDLEEVAWQVFGSYPDERVEKFKQSVLYYCRGNRNASTHISSVAASRFQDNDHSGKGSHGTDTDNVQLKDNDPIHCRSKFASETDESEVGTRLKPYFRRLETTFLKLLKSKKCDNRTLHMKCIGALCCLSRFNDEPENLYEDIFEAIRKEPAPIKAKVMFAFRCILKCSCIRLTANLHRKFEIALMSLFNHPIRSNRIMAAGCIGTLFGYLPDTEFEEVFKLYFLDDDESISWEVRLSKCISLMVALKESPAKILQKELIEKVTEILLSYLVSDTAIIVSCGIRASGYFMLHKLQIQKEINPVLLEVFCETMKHSDNEVKHAFGLVTNFLATKVTLPLYFIKAVVPFLINGTRDQNVKVKLRSKLTLVAVLDLYKGEEVVQMYLNTLEGDAQESLQNILNELKIIAQKSKPNEDELDFTLL